MPHILVVDDSAVERRIVSSLLEKGTGMRPVEIDNAQDALASIAREVPDLVVTDLMMPETDGMTLVEEINRKHPGLPVIMMTAYGNEATVVLALRKGAASYVPKQALTTDLLPTVADVLKMTRAGRQERQVQAYLTYTEHRFELENDPKLVTEFVGYLQSMLTRREFSDETTVMQAGIALCEALMNGLYHGNLEISSDLREDQDTAFESSTEDRLATAPYCHRRLHVVVKISSKTATYTIRDEGPGFDPDSVPDPTTETNLDRLTGRGLLLIRTFMDEVNFNASGNQIEMKLLKRKRQTEVADT